MKLNLPPALQRAAGVIDALTLRERAILFAVLLAALFLMADRVLFPSLKVKQKGLEQQITGQIAQLQTVTTQIDRIQAESQMDPDAVQRSRLEALRKQFAELQLSSASLTRGLVSPREMTRLVHDMLRQNRALQLVAAENLTPEPISLAAGDKQPPAGPALYRHGLRVQVKGSYLEIVRYLRSLEQLTWRVDWEQVMITTDHHPVSVCSFTLYTISLDKAWIGV